MAGLFGVYNPRGIANIRQIADRMLAVISTKAYLYKSVFVVDEYACFGYAGLPETDALRMPVLTEDGLSLIVIAGELSILQYDRQDSMYMKDRIEIIAEELRRGNFGYIEKLDGAFSMAWWDGRTRTLRICNDRFGLYPVYYCFTRETLIFSSEVKAILATDLIPKERNHSALAELFHFGHILQGKSLIKGISQL